MAAPDDQEVGTLRIAPVDGKKAIADWLQVPRRVFAGDPAWIAPLDIAERDRISPNAPIRHFGEVALFLAYRGAAPVGRISAQINRRYLAQHNDATGHFGFFDCLDDSEAANALVETAAAWLKARGMTRMAGPFNFSTNEECGCLVENFDSPPAVMMPHARVFTGALLEGAGLAKAMDLYSYRYVPGALPKLEKLAAMAGRISDIAIRPLDMKNYKQEVQILLDVFNDAWSGNWGFVPFGDEEIAHMAKEMRPVVRSEYGRILMIKGEPVGVMLAIPDINGLTASFNGKLFPFNWIKLLWDVQRQNTKGARVLLLGLRQSMQNSPLAGALLAMLAIEMVKQKGGYKLDWVDFSWVLETNTRMNNFARMIAGPPHKTHRLYEKTL